MRKEKAYELLYSRWGNVPEPEPGYSLLLLIPGDLPVFLQIAMEVCSRQAREERLETIVLPDVLTPGFERAFEDRRRRWDGGPLRVVPLRRWEQAVARRRHNPHFNCWLQFITGVRNARGSHAIWHDSDLFLGESGFLDSHYRRCRDRGLGLLGVSEAWDDWYAENGLPHVVSTWELAFDVGWARSFEPWEHRGHSGSVEGKPVTFDITFWPQTQTEPDAIARYESEPPFVHFNYTIGSYREFQQHLSRNEPWEDGGGFRVLLVRLLADALDRTGWHYEAPSVAQLLRGTEDSSAPVTYLVGSAPGNYAKFRNTLEELIGGGHLSEESSGALAEGIAPFDSHYGWRAT